MVDRCEEHAWASIGVTALGNEVMRVWACEHCPAWTTEELDDRYRVDWSDTWLAGM